MTDMNSASIDPGCLETCVALALGEPSVKLGDWQMKPLSGGMEVNNRLYLISGQARTTSGERPWSLVLKTVQRDPMGDANPQAVRYWKREALFYQSGMLEDISCTLVSPRCYQVNQEGELTQVWMEALQDGLPKPWPKEHLIEVARCLGCFNGTFLTGKPLPEAAWLTRRWLRGYAELAAPVIQDLPELRKMQLFQATYPDVTDDLMRDAWERRGEFLDVLERLPQTFCHQDAFEGNLFWRLDQNGQGQLVGLDWAYTGIASVGEELAALVFMAMSVPIEEKLPFYEACLEGYLQGLAEVGYTADREQVRFSSLVALFYRYFFGAMGELWQYARDEANHPLIAAVFGVPSIEYVVGIYRANTPFHKEIYAQICRQMEAMS